MYPFIVTASHTRHVTLYWKILNILCEIKTIANCLFSVQFLEGHCTPTPWYNSWIVGLGHDADMHPTQSHWRPLYMRMLVATAAHSHQITEGWSSLVVVGNDHDADAPNLILLIATCDRCPTQYVVVGGALPLKGDVVQPWNPFSWRNWRFEYIRRFFYLRNLIISLSNHFIEFQLNPHLTLLLAIALMQSKALPEIYNDHQQTSEFWNI